MFKHTIGNPIITLKGAISDLLRQCKFRTAEKIKQIIQKPRRV